MSSSRLRVVLEASCLSDARADGGIGRYARQLVESLGAVGGIDVVLSDPGRPPRSESRPGRFVHAQRKLLRTVRTARPHLVHGLGGEPAVLWPGPRQVVTLHDVEMWTAAGPPGVRGALLHGYGLVLGRLVRRCAGFIAVSDATAEEASAVLGLDRSELRVVPHGVSAAFTDSTLPGDDALWRKLGLAHRPYLLWVGSLRRHDPRKQLDTLLDALSDLQAPAPVLALAGAEGPEAERLRRRAEGLGLCAVLCGRRGDGELAALYRGAAAMVLPSASEGFGLTVLEAMACGAPVVATTGGNIPAIAGGAALLVRPGDAAALGEAIARVLSRPDDAAEFRRAGLARAAGRTWERCAEATVAFYRETLDRQPTVPRPPSVPTPGATDRP